ncbi:MAG: zinc-dependent metalloprotease family protein [Bacteroidota bacterium]
MKKLGSLLVLASILLLFPFYSQAQLIGNPLNPSQYGLDVSADNFQSEIIRKRYVSLNDWDMGSQLSLKLFPDVEIVFDSEKIEFDGKIKIWTGHIPGNEDGYVIISEQAGLYYAKIVDAAFRTFQLVHKGASVYAIYEIDPNNIPQNENDHIIVEEDVAESDNGICDPNYSCAAVTIDILAVYTPAAKNQMGSAVGIQNAISVAIAEMNRINTRSGVPHSYRLVHMEETNFTESGNSSTDLNVLRNPTDGIMDNVHLLRYTHSADLVALITSSVYCGIAYIQEVSTVFFPSFGFSVTGVNCMNTNYTLAHEIGHNMGLQHDWFVNTRPYPCPHSHGRP